MPRDLSAVALAEEEALKSDAVGSKAWKFCSRFFQCWETFSVDSNFFREVALWAEKNDLPLFIHPLSDPEVRKIIDYKRNHPNLKLIIAHLFGLELFIKHKFKDDNLYFDSSCPQLLPTGCILSETHGSTACTQQNLSQHPIHAA